MDDARPRGACMERAGGVLVLALLWLLVSAGSTARAGEHDASAQTAWRLLDYIAVDYREAVARGEIVKATEYAEMVEFAKSARARIETLPPVPAQAALLAEAGKLEAAIAAKDAPDAVAHLAHELADALLAAYPVATAPAAPPDLARGAVLYAEHCASCHGASGQGDGPDARGLDPPPIAFTDLERARERSLFGLYQVIDQGLEETAMASYAWLPPEDRWALAFHVGGMAYSQADIHAGERLRAEEPALLGRVPDLEALTRATQASLAAEIGEDQAKALLAYLRTHPEAAAPEAGGALATARARLAEALAAYERGDRREAADLALSAYLDGFEPVEPALAARDGAFMRKIEEAMIALRAEIGRDAPAAQIEARIGEITAMLGTAEARLAPGEASSLASFVGAFTILLREGLEAILIVVAMLAFLQQAGRTEAVAYVHGGWIAALAAGFVTWVVATYFVAISGAGRELTEGIGALLAAAVLISVGIWMHGKSQADAWQAYIHEKMARALSRGSAWFLFGLAFIVVYREAFETILFYMALWSQGGRAGILAGAGLAALLLAATAWALLRYSRRLPIGQFFLYSSVLIAILAVILAGKGIAALQEAGWMAVQPIAAIPRIEVLGFYPTWETVIAQIVTLGILLVAFWLNRRGARQIES